MGQKDFSNTLMSHSMNGYIFHKLSSLKFLSVPFRLTTRFHKTQKLLLHYLRRPLTEISSGKTVVQFVDLRGLFYLWVSLIVSRIPASLRGQLRQHIISYTRQRKVRESIESQSRLLRCWLREKRSGMLNKRRSTMKNYRYADITSIAFGQTLSS